MLLGRSHCPDEVNVSELPARYQQVWPATFYQLPVNTNITNEDCLLLESFQRDVHLFFKVWNDVTLTKYLETSFSCDRFFSGFRQK